MFAVTEENLNQPCSILPHLILFHLCALSSTHVYTGMYGVHSLVRFHPPPDTRSFALCTRSNFLWPKHKVREAMMSLSSKEKNRCDIFVGDDEGNDKGRGRERMEFWLVENSRKLALGPSVGRFRTQGGGRRAREIPRNGFSIGEEVADRSGKRSWRVQRSVHEESREKEGRQRQREGVRWHAGIGSLLLSRRSDAAMSLILYESIYVHVPYIHILCMYIDSTHIWLLLDVRWSPILLLPHHPHRPVIRWSRLSVPLGFAWTSNQNAQSQSNHFEYLIMGAKYR